MGGDMNATPKPCPECEVTVSLATQLIEDNKALKEAGSALAAAALRVTHEYDGVHRLALAVSSWATVVANEGGRKARADSVEVRKRWEGGGWTSTVDYGDMPVPQDDQLTRDMEFAIRKAEYLMLNDENQDEPITGLDRLQRLRAYFNLDMGGK